MATLNNIAKNLDTVYKDGTHIKDFCTTPSVEAGDVFAAAVAKKVAAVYDANATVTEQWVATRGAIQKMRQKLEKLEHMAQVQIDMQTE